MELYMQLDDVVETIGVEEDIVKSTLESRVPELEPYLRVVAGKPLDGSDTPSKQLQLRVDGLAPLIKKLSYNIPTDDIIENLICQVIHLTHLHETNEQLNKENQELLDENQELKETAGGLYEENYNLQKQVRETQDLHSQVEKLTQQLHEISTKPKKTRWFWGKK